MAEPVQSYKNHARFFPLFHFFAFPVLLLNFLFAAANLIRNANLTTLWTAIVALALAALALSARLMALTVQDRVIRLEMRLRLARVLPADLQQCVDKLSHRQLVALRFASDAELPELCRDVTDGRLQTSKEIKMRVKNWQADWLRA